MKSQNLFLIAVTAMLSLALAPMMCSAADQSAKTKTQSKSAQGETLHDETDKTDIYAVPLDEDEDEENEEIKMLDEKGAEAMKKKEDKALKTNGQSTKK